MKWTIYLLVGTLVALIPCVLYPEFITVFSLWEDWDYTHNRPHVAYSGANPPPVLRVVQPVFATIVLPPTQIAERLGARRGIYSYFAAQHAGLVPLGGSFHYNPPGLIAAGEYLIYGLPFWCIVVAIMSEVGLAVRRHRRRIAN
jgi:hypothetical protein